MEKGVFQEAKHNTTKIPKTNFLNSPTLNQRFCFKQKTLYLHQPSPAKKKPNQPKLAKQKNPTGDRAGDYRGESVKVLRRSRLSSTSRGRLCCCWLAICAQHLDVWMWDLDDVFLFLE